MEPWSLILEKTWTRGGAQWSIRGSLGQWLEISSVYAEVDPDLHQCERSGPDPHSSKKSVQDRDPHQREKMEQDQIRNTSKCCTST